MSVTNKSTVHIYRKHFIPLESNPEVFNELIHKLGVAVSIAFRDVFSLQEAEFLQLIPSPAYALILVFPTTSAYEKRCAAEDAEAQAYGGLGESESVTFYKQSINNACGLYAILHAISNGAARNYIANDSIMARLITKTAPLKPDERALALESSNEMEQVYASVADKGDTHAPDDPEEEVDFHYICFVRSHKDGHIYQLDGDRKRPIDLGPLGAEETLSSACLPIIRRMVHEAGVSMYFSLMALTAVSDQEG